MVIYARLDDYLSYIDTEKHTSGRMKPAEFFEQFKGNLLITFNGAEDSKRYKNCIIFSVTTKQTFLEYCAENKLNCGADAFPWARCDYEVSKIYNHFDEWVAPKLNAWNTIRKKYKLSAKVMGYSEIPFIMEILGLKN